MTEGATPAEASPSFAENVDRMWASIQDAFHVGDGLYAEHAPPRSDDRTYSYLWPFPAVLSAANARARLKGNDASKEDPRRTLEAAEAHFYADGDPPGYDSNVIADGGGGNRTRGSTASCIRGTTRWSRSTPRRT